MKKKNKTKKKGLISRRLGVVTEGPLTKTACLSKVRILRAGLKKNQFKGELRRYAVYYASWYRWKADKIKKAA